MAIITVFGSSNALPDSIEYYLAEELGNALAEKGFNIATGGYNGVMEAVLKGASAFDIERIGVLSKDLNTRQTNKYLNKIITVDSYLDRLKKLIEIGDNYIVLPGGTGTFLELAAVWALKERGIILNKKIVLIGEQWEEVLQTMMFYSEKLIDGTRLLDHVETIQEAVDRVSMI